jgi:hypothetical protein
MFVNYRGTIAREFSRLGRGDHSIFVHAGFRTRIATPMFAASGIFGLSLAVVLPKAKAGYALPSAVGKTAAPSRLLRRKRSDDRIKARIASQRIPKRIKTQMAVAQTSYWQIHSFIQLFDCAILVARPCINDGQILDQ